MSETDNKSIRLYKVPISIEVDLGESEKSLSTEYNENMIERQIKPRNTSGII